MFFIPVWEAQTPLAPSLDPPQGVKVKYITRVNNILSTYPSFGSRGALEYSHPPWMGYLSIPACLPGLQPPIPLAFVRFSCKSNLCPCEGRRGTMWVKCFSQEHKHQQEWRMRGLLPRRVCGLSYVLSLHESCLFNTLCFSPRVGDKLQGRFYLQH